MHRKMASLFVPLGLSRSALRLSPGKPTRSAQGFDTPTLSDSPGSQSVSNGIAELPGFAIDQARFERKHAAGDPAASLGLGPFFNATACAVATGTW
jgi:hypothetical protein